MRQASSTLFSWRISSKVSSVTTIEEKSEKLVTMKCLAAKFLSFEYAYFVKSLTDYDKQRMLIHNIAFSMSCFWYFYFIADFYNFQRNS